MGNNTAHIYTEISSDNDSEAKFCGNCDYYLGSYPTKIPKRCPNCKLELKEIGDIRIK